MNRLLLLLSVLLVLPTASALTVVSVPNSGYVERFIDSPQEDVYSFLQSAAVFNTTHRANVEVSAELGTVKWRERVEWRTLWTVENTTTTVNVTMEGIAYRGLIGGNNRDIRIYVEGEDAWHYIGFSGLWKSFDFQDSHFLGYAKNVQMNVPERQTGVFQNVKVWDWSQEPRIVGLDQVVTGREANVTGLYWVFPNAVAEARVPTNETNLDRYWIANLTDPTQWTVTTQYPDREPTRLVLRYNFETFDSFVKAVQNADREIAGCPYPKLFRLLTFCPSITGLVSWTVSLVPSTLGAIVSMVHPDAGRGLVEVGNMAGELVSTPFFLFETFLQKPVAAILVVIISTSGFVNLIAGQTGTMKEWFTLHLRAFKTLGFVAVWYFIFLWRAARWLVALFIRMLQAIGSFIPFT